MSVNFVLPFPPSSNRMWRMWRGHMVLSDEARAYKRVAGLIAREKCDAPASRPVSLTLTLYAPRRGRDASNCVKILEDSLQGYAYANDSQVDELHVYRRLDRQHPRVEVEIAELG